MRNWLKRFFGKENFTLVINDKTYSSSVLIRVGGGSEKEVFKIAGENFCFLIPNKVRDEETWNKKIDAEKFILDEMTKLGMKTQQFELVDIETKISNQPSYTIQALLTKDFERLCQDEALVIYDPKSDKRIFGKSPDFMAMRSKFKDKTFVQEMFKKLIKEYATAYTFSLPISAIQNNDDSEHICFELSSSIPTVRYMFWDVVADTSPDAFLPFVPTLSELRRGPDSFNWSRENSALFSLANTVACAILEIINYARGEQPANDFAFVREIQEAILAAIDEPAYLNDALQHAREHAVNSMTQGLSQINPNEINNNVFTHFLGRAISTNNLELVKRYYGLRPAEQLTETFIDAILNMASKYGNPDIVQFLNEKLGAEKATFVKIQLQTKVSQLRNTFFTQYNEQLSADKGAWCGLYSLFAKSYAKPDTNLHDLVKHAQGLSNEGSGKRSQLVMKQLGWLNENNQAAGELASVLEEEKRLSMA